MVGDGMKTTSLHHRESGFTIVLVHEGGRNWRLYASLAIQLGKGSGISQKDSQGFTERQLLEAIREAVSKGSRKCTLHFNGHEVPLIAANVIETITKAKAAEKKYLPRPPKRKKTKKR